MSREQTYVPYEVICIDAKHPMTRSYTLVQVRSVLARTRPNHASSRRRWESRERVHKRKKNASRRSSSAENFSDGAGRSVIEEKLHEPVDNDDRVARTIRSRHWREEGLSGRLARKLERRVVVMLAGRRAYIR